jgi:hypothetical protein
MISTISYSGTPSKLQLNHSKNNALTTERTSPQILLNSSKPSATKSTDGEQNSVLTAMPSKLEAQAHHLAMFHAQMLAGLMIQRNARAHAQSPTAQTQPRKLITSIADVLQLIPVN